MKKFSSLLILIIILCPILSGCTGDSKEIDDQVYTLVLGADVGVENKIRITVQYPIYKSGGGGMQKKGGGGGGAGETGEVGDTIVATVEASTILEGINLLNTATTRRISLVHCKAIIFSEKFARKGIREYLQPISRFREARKIMQVMVCRGTAENFIKENKTNIGESTAKAMELMIFQSDNTGYFPRAQFNEFYNGTLSPYEQAYCIYAGINSFNKLEDYGDKDPPLRPQYNDLPGDIPRRGVRKAEIAGTAIFDGDKMVGSLNLYETRYFLMITGKFKRGFITIADRHDPKSAIPLDVRLGRKTRIKAHFEKGKPVIDVKLNIEADLGAIQSRTPYEKLSKIDDLNDQIKTFIENEVKKTIQKTQKEYGIDIFGFGKKVAHNFLTVQEFEKYNWLKQYADAKVNVEVETNVRRTGLMVGSSPIRDKDEDIITGGD